MITRLFVPAILASLASLSASTSVRAETITVCADGCDFTSINAAIDAAVEGDVIQLSAETYYEGAVIDLDGKAITLRGWTDNGVPLTEIHGGDFTRVLIVMNGEGADTVFEDLVIRNGNADIGAGMFIDQGCSPTLSNCTFSDNTASFFGGGMFNEGSPTLNDCTFSDNTASSYCGGMGNNFGSSPLLNGCTFTSNSANVGGGMYNLDRKQPGPGRLHAHGQLRLWKMAAGCTTTDSSSPIPDRLWPLRKFAQPDRGRLHGKGRQLHHRGVRHRRRRRSPTAPTSKNATAWTTTVTARLMKASIPTATELCRLLSTTVRTGPTTAPEDGTTITVAVGQSIRLAVDAVPAGGTVEIAVGYLSRSAYVNSIPGGKAVTIARLQPMNRACCSPKSSTAATPPACCNVVSGEGPDTIFENLVIQNGFNRLDIGGGMYNDQGSSPTLTNCMFT